MTLPGQFGYQKPKKKVSETLVPEEWNNPVSRPRGVDLKNGIYFMLDAPPAKNSILFSSNEVLRLKELSFFLIWRYQKTYTREFFEQSYAGMFTAFQDFMDMKRNSLEGITGLFNGIPFGDKQFKFKQSFHVGRSVPNSFFGADLVIGLTVERVQGPSGNIIKDPQAMASAYKELKIIFTQELDYMSQNPAFNKQEGARQQSA